jgi:SPP1 family predicted phage head-tail adaptor
MRAGQLRNQIEIHRPVETADGLGGYTRSWVKIANGDAWAQIHGLRGQERIEAMQNDQRLDAIIRMRFRDDIRPEYRIVHGNQVYEIVSGPINVDMRNIMIELTVREII